MSFETRRIFALMLLFVAITALVISFGENVLCAGELPGAHGALNSLHEHDSPQVHDSNCPCAPSPADSSRDHFCADDCGCPCHAPLRSTLLTLTYSGSSTYLDNADLIRHIPEVYLSLFVPPDSAAI
jgi:hypothetical protein